MANVFSLALIAAAFIVSLFLRGTQDIHYAPALIALCAALLLSLFRARTVPAGGPVLALLLLWALASVGFMLSPVPLAAQIAFCIFSALPLAFFAARGIDTRKLGFCALPVLASLAVAALAQSAFVPDGPYGRRAAWPLIDPNTLATLLNIGLIVTAGFALSARNEKATGWTILAALFFAALIATGSRSGMLAAAIALAILAASVAGTKSRNLALGFAALIAAACIAALFTGNPASISDRMALWQAALRMIADHPFIGTGPGSFALYYPAYRQPADQSLGYFAHCDPLQMAVEMGLAAPLLLYAFLALIITATIRALRDARDPLQRNRILVPFAALIAIAVQAHVNFPLYSMPVLIACGVLLALWHNAVAAPVIAPQKIWPVRISAVMVVLAILSLAVPPALAYHFLHRAAAERDVEKSLILLARADMIGPASFIDPEVEIARANLRMIENGSIKSPHLKKNLLAETGRVLDTAATWNPAWAEIDALRGNRARIEGQKAVMLDSWFTALRKNPMQSSVRRDLAEALRNEGRNDEARKLAAEGLNYPHTLTYREWTVNFLKNH